MVRQNTVARIESGKAAGSFHLIYYVIHCLNLYLKIVPGIECIMFPPVDILFIQLRWHCFNTVDLFCVKYQETRTCSLLQ